MQSKAKNIVSLCAAYIYIVCQLLKVDPLDAVAHRGKHLVGYGVKFVRQYGYRQVVAKIFRFPSSVIPVCCLKNECMLNF